MRPWPATEGVFCEPASAASVAGVMKLSRQGGLREGETVVCTLDRPWIEGCGYGDQRLGQTQNGQSNPEEVARLLNV